MTATEVGLSDNVIDEDTADWLSNISIHQRMVMILAELMPIGRDQRNTQQNFSYRGYDDMMNALNPLFGKYGVYLVPNVIERITGERQTSGGKTMYEVNLHIEYTFFGLKGDFVKASGWGEGTDMGDKATNKATTAALKYVLDKVFAIATAEASDADGGSPEPTTRGAAPVERRVEGPPPYPIPKSWKEIEKAIRKCDNSEEAWALHQAFVRAASHHLFDKADSSELEQAEKDVLFQRAARVAVALHGGEFAETVAEFVYFTEDAQRKAWASALSDGVLLEIPDYVPPVDSEANAAALEAWDEAVKEYDGEPAEGEPAEGGYS